MVVDADRVAARHCTVVIDQEQHHKLSNSLMYLTLLASVFGVFFLSVSVLILTFSVTIDVKSVYECAHQ